MKICMDGLSINQLQGTGLFTYSYELLSGLLTYYPQSQYELIWNNEPGLSEWNGYKNVSYIRKNINRKLNDYTAIEEYLTESKTHLYHSPNNGLSLPLHKVCRYIMTVHDVSPLSCKELVDEKYYKKFMDLFPSAVEKADAIIAVSQFIKTELLHYFRIPEYKIHVIHPCCSPIFRNTDKHASWQILKDKYKIQNNYILYCGSIHQRKNLVPVLNAFSHIIKQHNLQFVIVGDYENKRHEYALLLKNIAKKLEIENKVNFTGVVPLCDMPYFYSCASCTVNLSSYEGYPITVVEAMSCNSPVLCARSSSFEEAVGENKNAVLLDSIDEETIAKSIKFILDKRPILHNNGSILYDHHLINSNLKKIINLYESTVYGTL